MIKKDNITIENNIEIKNKEENIKLEEEVKLTEIIFPSNPSIGSIVEIKAIDSGWIAIKY